MAGTPIGRILLIPKGDYSGIAVYNALDWVRQSGSSWVCTTDNTTGVTPAVGVPEWQLLASDGSVGGWDSLSNKPFETLGKGVKKDADDSLTLNVTANLLLGSKLDVDVQSTYVDTETRPINAVGVASAISGKADKTELDDWVAESYVDNGSVTFTGVDDSDNNAYEVYFKITSSTINKTPYAKLSSISDEGTNHMSVTFETDADAGNALNKNAKLRRLK